MKDFWIKNIKTILTCIFVIITIIICTIIGCKSNNSIELWNCKNINTTVTVKPDSCNVFFC